MVAGLLVRLAQSMAETGNLTRSKHLFNEADKIYKVVPGVEHPFYTEVSLRYKRLSSNINDHVLCRTFDPWWSNTLNLEAK